MSGGRDEGGGDVPGALGHVEGKRDPGCALVCVGNSPRRRPGEAALLKVHLIKIMTGNDEFELR